MLPLVDLQSLCSFSFSSSCVLDAIVNDDDDDDDDATALSKSIQLSLS